MCVCVVAVFIANGYAEHNIALFKLEFRMGYFPVACFIVTVASAKTRDENVGSGSTIYFNYVVLNVKGVNSWRIFAACTPKVAALKRTHNFAVIKRGGTYKG